MILRKQMIKMSNLRRRIKPEPLKSFRKGLLLKKCNLMENIKLNQKKNLMWFMKMVVYQYSLDVRLTNK